MNLDRTRLENVLNVLGTSVGNKVMQVASYICFTVDKEKKTVVVATTDFHAYLKIDFGDVTLAGIEDAPDIFLIDYRELSAIVKGSTTETVSFSDEGNNIIVTTNGRYRFSKYIKTEDFPFANMNHSVVASWPVPVIQAAWTKASIACSKDVIKMSYQGIYFDGNFVATDNRRISIVEGNDYDGAPMLIPPVFGNVLKYCKNNVTVGINNDKNLLVISCPEVGLLAGVRLIDATFVDYKQILQSKDISVTATVPKQALLGAIQRLSIFSDKLFKVIELKLRYEEDTSWSLTVSIDNKDAGEEKIAVTDVDVANEDAFADASDKCPDGFDVQHHKYHIDNLCDGVGVVDSPDEVELSFEDNGKLWIQEGTFTYLLSSMIE